MASLCTADSWTSWFRKKQLQLTSHWSPNQQREEFSTTSLGLRAHGQNVQQAAAFKAQVKLLC